MDYIPWRVILVIASVAAFALSIVVVFAGFTAITAQSAWWLPDMFSAAREAAPIWYVPWKQLFVCVSMVLTVMGVRAVLWGIRSALKVADGLAESDGGHK